tara:strand:+ start:250 stop:2205 length:1956 start_codon:yes stop_codon:yes gene_type:complete
MIIIEFLNFKTLLYFFANKNLLKSEYGNEIRFLYNDGFFFKFFKLLVNMLGFKCIRFDFKLINIRDKSGEIVILRITREELFKVQNIIEKDSEITKLLDNQINFFEKNYIYKSIIAEPPQTKNKKSLWKLIFIINVIDNVFKEKNKIFILNERLFQKVISTYAKNYNIKIAFINIIINFYFLIKVKKIKNILKYLRNRIIEGTKNHTNNIENKIFCESYGQVNLTNKNYKSDFFWVLNSSFPKKNVFFDCKNKEEANYLKNNSISFSFKHNFSSIKYLRRKKGFFQIYAQTNNLYKEKHYIEDLIQDYRIEKEIWKNYYKQNNIRVIFNWYRYEQKHILKHEAISELGGISCLWQFAFEGHKYYDIKSFADINFSYSNFSADIHDSIGSGFKQQVIVGLPTYKLDSKTISKSTQIRKNLMANGAKKIICVLDENSHEDERWHTGNSYQQEIYELIINELLSNKDLGIIFKPKVSFTLKKRLKHVNQLLNEALKTKRCFIYSDNIKRSTSVPPLIAALSSDLVIHSALSAGTAALECAQKRIPTILIDREKAKLNKLSELPKNKIVFDNFQTAITEINNHFFKNKPIEGFGDWSKYIQEFDPFNDDNGAYRIGEYLNKIICGYNQSLQKEEVLSQAAIEYTKKWGKDKIIFK